MGIKIPIVGSLPTITNQHCDALVPRYQITIAFWFPRMGTANIIATQAVIDSVLDSADLGFGGFDEGIADVKFSSNISRR